MAETMDMAQMMVHLGIAPGDQAKINSALDGVNEKLQTTSTTADSTSENVKKAGVEFGRFNSPVLEAIFAVQAFTSELRETISAIGELSGIKAAAEFMHISNALENVIGSAKEAKEVMEQIDGLHSAYNNKMLMAIVPTMINTGMSASQAVNSVSSLTKAGALGALDNNQMPAFMREMVKMRGENHPMIRSLLSEMPSIPLLKLVNAGAGTHFTDSNQANRFLEGHTGKQAYEIITKGADALGGLANATLLVREPAMALAKIFETIEEIMAPTGALFIAVLSQALPLIQEVAEVFKRMNEMTSGIAGLALIIGVVRASFGLMKDTFFAAVRFTRELTLAVREYGEAAEVAAVATRDKTALNAVTKGVEDIAGTCGCGCGGGIGGGVKKGLAGDAEAEGAGIAKASGIARIGPWLKGLFTNPKAATALGEGVESGGGAVGLAAKAGEFFTGAITKFVKGGGLIGIVASIGLGAIGDHIGGKAGGILKGTALGISIGGLAGSIIPGLGNVVGSVIGGVIGGGWAALKHDPAKNDNTDALNDNTAALTELKGHMVGGGERARQSVGQIETEHAVTKYLMSMAKA